MSQRTVVEFRHDFVHAIAKDGDLFVRLLERALSGGSKDDWKPLEHFGVRRAAQRSESEPCRVVIGSGSLKREFSL